MNKIGTHNSCTSHKPHNLLSWLITPFARCQSKTLIEQFNMGCRYFDLRVDEDWHIRHGLWKSKDTLDNILQALEDTKEEVFVMITYEGALDKRGAMRFTTDVHYKLLHRKNIVLTQINQKKPYWQTLWQNDDAPWCVSKFKNLDGSTWHTYLPIPWLWKKLYFNKPTFNNEHYTLVDFL